MRTKRVIGIASMLLVTGLVLSPSRALAFNSGSTGSNGAFPPAPGLCTAGIAPEGTAGMMLDLRDGTLRFTSSTGTVLETRTLMVNCHTGTPVASTGFPDGIMHFTTMNVPASVTLRFVRNNLNTPVQILAQGDVTIAGTIDINGSAGGPAQQGNGKGGFGGPGGFKGGNGQTYNATPKGGDGLGPSGGRAGTGNGSIICGSGAGFGAVGNTGTGNVSSATYGTSALLPLVGGSGGGGGPSRTDDGSSNGGAGGGGGGGAILIASSTTIGVTGAIQARGGTAGENSGCAGGGSGGAIRLLANTLSGNGVLDTSGGGGTGGWICCPSGGAGGRGRIRLEANFFNFTGSTTGNRSDGGPGFVFLANTPTVRIVSVDNVTDSYPAPAIPIGGFGGADIAVPGPGAYTVTLAATNVPLGTTIAVTAKPETDLANPASATSTALTGTAATSTARATMTFDSGGLYFLEARATFQLP